MTRYSEPELVIPALVYIRDNPGGVYTSQLIRHLTALLKPDGHDMKILNNRKDTHFSQKVRNLTSHGTLEKKNLARYTQAGKYGTWEITREGLQYLERIDLVVDDSLPEDIASSLANQGFASDVLDEEADRGYSGIIIEEGALDKRTTGQRSRSNLLREAALREFKREHDGRLFCIACAFDFREAYGDIGTDFIELHHLQPVHLMDVEGEAITLGEALKKVATVCSNCHRMIHRAKGEMLSIEDLKALLSTVGPASSDA